MLLRDLCKKPGMLRMVASLSRWLTCYHKIVANDLVLYTANGELLESSGNAPKHAPALHVAAISCHFGATNTEEEEEYFKQVEAFAELYTYVMRPRRVR